MSRVGLAAIAGAVMVPIVEIPAIWWAVREFSLRHPQEVAERPATISRATTDAVVEATLPMIVLLCSIPIIIASWRVALAYRDTFLAYFPEGSWQRKTVPLALGVGIFLQAAALLGLNLSTQVTLKEHTFIHMTGSFVFFISQVASIILCGIACSYLARYRSGLAMPDDGSPALSLKMHRFRARFALVIAVQAVVYMALFTLKDIALPIERYYMLAAFAILERIVISCFILFLTSYVPDLVEYERRRAALH
jgi:hypothetical protein